MIYIPVILYTAIISLALVGIHISMSYRREPFYRLLIGLLCIMAVHTLTTSLIQFVFPHYTYMEIGSLMGWLYPSMAYYMLKTGTGYRLTKKDILHLLPFVVVLPFFVSSFFMKNADVRLYDSIIRGGMGLIYLGYLIWAISYRSQYKKDQVGVALKSIGWSIIFILAVFLLSGVAVIWNGNGATEARQATDAENLFIFSCMLIIVWQLYLHVIRSYKVRAMQLASETSTSVEQDDNAKEQDPAFNKGVRIEYKRYVKLVDKFIANKHYLDPSMNMEKLASLVNIPKTHLPLLFQNHYKMTFNQFLNQLRIQYACKRLEEPSFSLSVDELADECGFRSRASFYRNFNQEKSCTPLEYRKNILLQTL